MSGLIINKNTGRNTKPTQPTRIFVDKTFIHFRVEGAHCWDSEPNNGPTPFTNKVLNSTTFSSCHHYAIVFLFEECGGWGWYEPSGETGTQR